MPPFYNPVFALLGISIIILVTIDVVATNTTQIGEGRLTKWWQQTICHLSFRAYKHWQNRSILVWSGAFIVLGMVLIWILLLWAGWIAIFCSGKNAIINSADGQPADFWARVYFAGFSISGLGTGDYIPQEAYWQVLTAIASLNGLLLTSLIIGFVIPIAQAEAHRRRIALTVFYTGKTDLELLLNTWNPSRNTILEQLLNDLISELIKLDQKHASFPFLHRFSNYRSKESVAIAIATLDEALTIAKLGMKDVYPQHYCLARQAISGYLASLKAVGLKPAKKIPPIPDLNILRQAGLPVVSDRLWLERLETVEKRRRCLLALVEQSGWSWKEVASSK